MFLNLSQVQEEVKALLTRGMVQGNSSNSRSDQLEELQLSVTLLGSHLLIGEAEVNCYLVKIQASQRLIEDNKADCYLVVFQAAQRLTGGT